MRPEIEEREHTQDRRNPRGHQLPARPERRPPQSDEKRQEAAVDERRREGWDLRHEDHAAGEPCRDQRQHPPAPVAHRQKRRDDGGEVAEDHLVPVPGGAGETRR